MTGTPPRRLGRSALALFLGFLAVLVLSIGTDFVLHALIMSTAGAVTMMPLNLGPAWYPIALVISTLPCAWLGGLLYRAPQAAH